MEKTRVIVVGANGRMGREVVKAVAREGDLQLVGGVDVIEDEIRIDVGGREVQVKISSNLEESLNALEPHVLVDFTRPGVAMNHFRLAIAKGVSPVIGTTGITPEDIEEAGRLCAQHQVGAVIAPNFAIGAVLMMKFAEMAAPYLPDVEIIELHHNAKLDAPSGTALKTAEAINRVKERWSGSPAQATNGEPAARGMSVGGIQIHSVRLPGLVAHQEVIFGGPGQVLTIRHDSLSRESFMPGVILAIRRVRGLKELVYGLDRLLGL